MVRQGCAGMKAPKGGLAWAIGMADGDRPGAGHRYDRPRMHGRRPPPKT